MSKEAKTRQSQTISLRRSSRQAALRVLLKRPQTTQSHGGGNS